MNHRLAVLPYLMASFSSAYALPPVIDNSVYPGSATPANAIIPGTPPSNAVMDLMTKIEQLQSDVRQLTGKVEEQNHQINELKKRQEAFSGDFDERISVLENKTLESGSAAADATTAPSPAPSAAPEGMDATNGASSGDVFEGVDQEAAETPDTQSPPVPHAENEQYKQSILLLRHGRTEESIEGFKAFLSQYPDSKLAGDVQFWLGEAYRAKRDDVSAMKAFNDVITRYPNSLKVPDALLKLGDMAVEQNQIDQAREYLNRVISAYPNTRPAFLAERKLTALGSN